MRWAVTYQPSAEADLATLWLNATDRQTVAEAADVGEAHLPYFSPLPVTVS